MSNLSPRPRPALVDQASPAAGATPAIKQAIKEAIEEGGIKQTITDAVKDAVDKIVEQAKENGKVLSAILALIKKGPDFVMRYIWEIATAITLGLIAVYFAEIVEFLKQVTSFIQTTGWPMAKTTFNDLVAAAKELINGLRR